MKTPKSDWTTGRQKFIATPFLFVQLHYASAVAGLTVFSGVVPNAFPSGPALFVGPDNDGPLISHGKNSSTESISPAWKIGPELTSPLIADQNSDTPLLRHVRLQNVLLDGGRNIQVSESLGQATPLLKTADDAIVMASIERTAGRILILSANLDSSDLPLRIAFPILMTNSVNWFLRQSNEIQPAISTGSAKRVAWTQSEIDSFKDQISFVNPSGRISPLQIQEQRIVIGPQRNVGIYGAFANLNLLSETDVTARHSADSSFAAIIKNSGLLKDGQKLRDTASNLDALQALVSSQQNSGVLFAVNLCRAAESDLRLAELPVQKQQQIPASGLPIWLILSFVAGTFILVEWALYHRRVVA